MERLLETEDLQGHRAGLVSRAAANSVDLLVIAVVAAAAYFLVAGLSFVISPRRFSFPRPAPGASLAFYFLATTIYLGVGWSATGRTVGKQLAGLRMLTDGRTRVPPVIAFARAIVCVVFPAGLLWCAISTKNASLHDLLFKTVVIYDWSSRTPPRSPVSFDTESRAP
jgi:uncharacterized RDD family membrane protein YckC